MSDTTAPAQPRIPLLLLALNTPGYIRPAVAEKVEVISLRYKRGNFPGGEVFFRLEEPGLVYDQPVLITARLRSSDDVMALLMAPDALRQADCGPISLKVPYFPYGRQDRVSTPGEALSARVMTGLLNAQNYQRIIVLEPHSDVTGALLQHLTIQTNASEQFATAVRTSLLKENGGPGLDNVVLVGPDSSAQKRGPRLAQELGLTHIARGGKVHDPVTNELSNFTCDRLDFEGKVALIADDLVDGAGTFAGLAAILKGRNVGGIRVMATHGLLTKGLAPFRGLVDTVYVTNSFKDVTDIEPVAGVTLNVFQLHLF